MLLISVKKIEALKVRYIIDGWFDATWHIMNEIALPKGLDSHLNRIEVKHV